MTKRVLIISFDIPFPDNYGGVKDVWQRILLLKASGHFVDLISFYKSRQRFKRFEESTERLIVDQHLAFKQKPIRLLGSKLPISVTLRTLNTSEILLCKELLKCNYDCIIVEGYKCLSAFLAIQKNIAHKKSILRVHNIESNYFKNLAITTSNPIKKVFYSLESQRFNQIERSNSLNHLFTYILFISKVEAQDQLFDCVTNKFVIQPYLEERTSTYFDTPFNSRTNNILYLGNLDLPDNLASVKEIIKILLPVLEQSPDITLTIAGKSESRTARKVFSYLLKRLPNFLLLENLHHTSISELYHKSKIFYLYSMNPSGVKLKLIESLSFGLPTISNYNGFVGSGLENAVINADELDQSELRNLIKELLTNQSRWQDERKKVIDTFSNFSREASTSLLNLI